MICSHCKEKIDFVTVVSKAWQEATIKQDDKGKWKVIEYDETNLGETLNILCPECDGNLSNEVKE